MKNSEIKKIEKKIDFLMSGISQLEILLKSKDNPEDRMDVMDKIYRVRYEIGRIKTLMDLNFKSKHMASINMIDESLYYIYFNKKFLKKVDSLTLPKNVILEFPKDLASLKKSG